MEDDEAKALDGLAHYVGVPVSQWGEQELWKALRMSMAATDAVRRMAVESMVRAEVAEVELTRRKRPGRPRKVVNALAKMVKPKLGKHHLPETMRQQLLNFMDQHPTDTAGIEAWITDLHKHLGGKVSFLRLRGTERNFLRNQVFRARIYFSRPRRNNSQGN